LYILNSSVLMHLYRILSLTNLSREFFTLDRSKLNETSFYFGNIWLSNICSIDILLLGSLTKILLIKDIDSCETFLNSSCSKLSFPTCTFLIISLFASPPNGGYPHNMTYYKIPKLQISYILLYVF